MRVAILDDYMDIALKSADWDALRAGTTVERFTDHLADEDALARRLENFDIIVAMRERTTFSRSLLERLPNLKFLMLSNPLTYNKALDFPAATACGVVVTYNESFARSTMELTWGLIFALVRNIPWEDQAVRAGRWSYGLGRCLQDRTLGVLGVGRIGSEIAALGRAFGMRVIAWSPNLTDARAKDAGAARVDKETLFREADVITVHLALDEPTRGIVGERELALMKETAYLVNTARAAIVDEAALIHALENRAIAGAALDVFQTEPLPADHPLRRLDNVILTPHIGYNTEENFRVYYESAVENIQAFLAGKPIRVVKAKGQG